MNETKRAFDALLLAWALTFELTSCGGISFGTETNTNFLDACVTDAECGGENACRCGICTVSCDSDVDCQQGQTTGVCATDDNCAAVSLCFSNTAAEKLNLSRVEDSGSVDTSDMPVGTDHSTLGQSTGLTSDMSAPSYCTQTAIAYEEGLPNVRAFPGVESLYVYGDSMTTMCIDNASTPDGVCIWGDAPEPGEQFENWGVGIGLRLSAKGNDAGDAIEGWDAAALGIVSIRINITNLAGRVLHLEATQGGDAAIPESSSSYSANPFAWGGTNRASVMPGVTSVALKEFQMTQWGRDSLAALGITLTTDTLDSSNLASVQFQVANDAGDVPGKYSFCLTDLQWLDAAGNIVPL